MSRDQMILDSMPQVEFLARRMWCRLGRRKDLEVGDLISAGYIGLIKAVDNYDGSTKISTYARHRIEGEMLDYLRSIDPLSREHRAEVKGTLCEPKHVGVTFDISDPQREHEKAMARTVLAGLMNYLNSRERFVIANDHRSRQGLAREMKITTEELSEIRKRAIEKMSAEVQSNQMNLFSGERYLYSVNWQEAA